MKNKILSGIIAGLVTFSAVPVTVPSVQLVSSISCAAAQGQAEKFIKSAEKTERSILYTCDTDKCFKMNGRTYYQGVVLGDGSYKEGSQVTFNVEDLNSISFDFGHVDDSDTRKSVISVYLDDVMTDQFEIDGHAVIKEYSIDVSKASTLRVSSSSSYSQYAMGNVSVDSVNSATPAVVPEYKTAEDFVRSNYDNVRATVLDDSDSPNNLDRKKFKINGRTYYQGIILGDGSYNEGSQVSFNVENLSSISFDFGHVDDSDTRKSVISVYLDDVMTDQFEIDGHDVIKEYSIDVSKASTMRITSSSNYSRYAMGNISVDSIKASTPAVVPEYKTAEDFVRSNYNNVRATVLDDSDSPNNLDRKKFKINGRTYYQGIILGDGSYNEGSQISFNVENLSSISFDFGHVDNSDTRKSVISVYLDDVMTDQFEIDGHDVIKEYSIDVSKASTMRITSSSNYSRYAMGNISVDSIKAATPAVVPEYKTAEDFVRSNYNTVRVTALDDSSSPNALDRKKFKINGRTYYQGIILGDGSYNDGSQVSFNVESLNSISFDFGHVDNSDTRKSVISVYLDDVMTDQFEIVGHDVIKEYSIDVSKASTMRITSSSNYSRYAMGNISVDSIKAATPAVVPEYKTAEDFVRSNYNPVRSAVLDDSDSPNAIDRSKFIMNGKIYYQGLVLGDGSYNDGSQASFNVENLSSISFELGHVDDSNTKASKISVYLDNVMLKQFELDGDTEVSLNSIDVSKASTMRITSSSNYSKYALGNISITASGQDSTTTTGDSAEYKAGDSNCDGEISIADAVMIMQSLVNSDEYKLTAQGQKNADIVDSDGITGKDALAIQMVVANIIDASDLPVTSADMEKLQ